MTQVGHPTVGVINPHAALATSPAALLASLWRNWQLILQMTRREVLSRYRGSALGLAWSFFHPLLMLAIFTSVFQGIFKARWAAQGEESTVDFAIILFAGMIVHGFLAECLNRAPGLVLANVNYVKKVVFPLEVLAWITVASALFHTAVSLLALLLAKWAFGHPLHWTIVLTPVVLAPLVLGTVGLTWFLASLGVFLRDLGQIIGLVTTALLFLSPVFYPVSAVPEDYRWLIQLNPLTLVIEQARKVLIWGELPDWAGLALYTAGSCLVAWVGFWWFQRTRRGFADVV